MTLRLDFTTLRLFLAIAKTKNLTRAAEMEHIASSAVSKRLSDLELMLGTPLFYRLPRGVELTPAGEAMQHHAQSILTSADRLAADLGDYAAGIKGHVRMAANQSSLAEYLPADLTAFCAQHPQIAIDLQEMNSGAILQAVAEGRCDLGLFVGDETGFPDVECRIYRHDRFVLVVPKGHAFADRDRISFSETLSEYYIGLETATAWDALVSKAVAEAGASIRFRFRLRDSISAFRMVAAGLGIFVAPYGTANSLGAAMGLQTIDLVDAWAHRRLSIATRDAVGLPPPARLMLTHLTASAAAAAAQAD